VEISQEAFPEFSTKAVTFNGSVFALLVFTFFYPFRPTFRVFSVVDGWEGIRQSGERAQKLYR